MMLHGVEAPNIAWQDSLSEDNKYRNAFSLIMTNPPFTGSLDNETVSKDILAVAKIIGIKEKQARDIALDIREKCLSLVD